MSDTLVLVSKNQNTHHSSDMHTRTLGFHVCKKNVKAYMSKLTFYMIKQDKSLKKM